MRLPTRNFLTTVALAGAVALVVVASLGGVSGFFTGALVCLLLAAAVSFFRVDRRAPSESETQAFVTSVLGGRGYAGAFQIRSFSQMTSAGIEPGNVRVKFRGELTFHEGLFQPAAPPADVFKGFTARKIEWLRKSAEMLERELGSLATGLGGRAPRDPYQATYVAERRAGGWSLEFTGSAWASWRSGSWFWDLRNLSQSIDSLVVLGKPFGAYPDAVALGSAEGRAWLNTCLTAWREYEAEIVALQQKIDELRAERARQAMGGFFRDVQAGTTYQGMGESLSQQVPNARYFLEFVSAHAANQTVAFTLRSDHRWQAARPFSGTVSFEPGPARVTIHARTTAADAQPQAGPLLSVATGFELEMQWFSGEPARLEGSAVDLALRLVQVPPGDLAQLLEEVQVREREVATAIAPGAVYRGSVTVAGSERPLRIEFMPAIDPTAGAARVESGDWSGMFRVVTAGEILENAFDVALESTVRSASTRAAADAGSARDGSETWSRVLLKLASGRFEGSIVSGESRLAITQLTRTLSP